MKKTRKDRFESTCSTYKEYEGMGFEILRELTEEEHDEEVGQMYKIILNNGKIIDVFEDEIFDYKNTNLINKINKKINREIDKDGWFNFTKWHIDDIKSALEDNEIKPSEKNIEIFFEQIYEDLQEVIVARTNQIIDETITIEEDKFN